MLAATVIFGVTAQIKKNNFIMHKIQIPSSITLSADDVIEPGTYLGEDVFSGQLLVMAGGGTMTPLEETRKPQFELETGDGFLMTRHTLGSVSHSKQCRSILFGRTGGLGDLTLLTPVLREIKRRWPSVRIAVASIRELQQSIQNLPFIDELLAYPVLESKAQEYDGWVWLEGVMEKNPDAKELHSVDCVAKFIGLPLADDTDKVQAYVVTQKERAWAQWAYPRIEGIRRICVQVGASATCRTYPAKQLQQVLGELLAKQWEVFLMGREGEIKADTRRPGLRIITDGYTFRQRAALIETADCVLAPDSSLTHIAGALAVPCVALYGPFHWKVRTAYNPLTKALTGHGFSCNPCNHHQHFNKVFPENCPTRDKGHCGVLAAITPEKIVATIEEIAKPLSEDGKVVGFEAK